MKIAGLRVAIVGGGPGGAHCAGRLVEAGAAVTLFEARTSFEKACGGGVPARGIERFPFLDDDALKARTIRRCVLVSPSGREAAFPMREPLHVFSRAALHDLLLRRAVAAGARLVRRRVVSFARDAAWTVRTAPERGDAADPPHGPFDFLVGADGASGMSRRRLAGAARPEGLAQGIGAFIPGLSEDCITLKFYPGLRGYLWVFPRPGHSSAGICGPLGAPPAAALVALMDGFLENRYGRAALRDGERYAALIPGWPGAPSDAALQGDGWALVGDAAGLVDPLTREGIYYAMLSGAILADCCAAGLPEEYADRLRAAFGAELTWAAARSGAFFGPRFLDAFVALAGASPAVAAILSDLIAGRQPYATLRRRLLRRAPRVALDAARGALAAAGRRRRGGPVLSPGRGSRGSDR